LSSKKSLKSLFLFEIIKITIIFRKNREEKMTKEIQYFNSLEAAKILGVNVSTIKRWTDEGKLECIQSAGGHRKFLMSHLAGFLENNKKKTSKVNLFPIEDETDLQISHHILKGDFDYLITYLQEQALVSSRSRVQQVMNGLYLAQYPLHQIYDHLITPVLHNIGALWEQEKISVATEHLATQTVRDSIIRLQGIIRIPREKIGNVLCLNFSDELHDIALKMVDHVLEARGFKVLFTGQITPLVNIEALFDVLKPERVYISSTFVNDTSLAQTELDQICKISTDYGAFVYIGGRGFDALKIDHPQVKTRLKTFEDVATY
jgi:excisionase family DNA binding protein